MAKVVVLGAGVAGHTAASYLQKYLSKQHQITVVSPTSTYQWIPSNIWVGVGRMTAEDIKFDPYLSIKNGVLNFCRLRQ